MRIDLSNRKQKSLKFVVCRRQRILHWWMFIGRITFSFYRRCQNTRMCIIFCDNKYNKKWFSRISWIYQWKWPQARAILYGHNSDILHKHTHTHYTHYTHVYTSYTLTMLYSHTYINSISKYVCVNTTSGP